jgi:hypothetical protein
MKLLSEYSNLCAENRIKIELHITVQIKLRAFNNNVLYSINIEHHNRPHSEP